jgi:nucleotide-binding universal stress UspA family protein
MNETKVASETAGVVADENAHQMAGENAHEMASDPGGAPVGFRRVLLIVDESNEARAAARYAGDVARQFGGTLATLTVTEAKARQRVGHLSRTTGRGRDDTTCTVSGPTVGARSHTLAEEVARAADDFDADVVVLGLSRARLARHRLAPSVRALVAQATEVPVLLAPAAWGDRNRNEAGRSETGQNETDGSETDNSETGTDAAVPAALVHTRV